MSKKRKMKMQRVIAIGLCAVTMVSFAGCQKSPDSSIVVNKDLDKLIEQAENTVEDGLILEQEYDTYQTTVEDKSLGVKVNVDAKVDVPRADKMSVLRVGKQEVTQELLDAIRKELLGDTVLYDGEVLRRSTKSELEEQISLVRNELKYIEDGGDKDKEKYKESYKRNQEELKELEKRYNTASKDVSFKGAEKVEKFQSIEEKYKEDPSNEFYEWFYSLVPEGNTFFGASDGSDGNYSTLYAVNSEDYSNYISFRTGKHGYEHMGLFGFTMPQPDKEYLASTTVTPIPDETANLSLETAVGIADQFLEKVGINNETTEFRYCEGGLTKEVLDIDRKYDLEGKPERTYYVLTYMRYIDGAFVNPGGIDKFYDNRDNGIYTKKVWPTEKIEFRINDSGIVGFDYTAPLKITEVVVDKAAMKSFEDVCDIFKKMSVVTNATEYSKVQLDVERIALGYCQVSEPETFDTGLLVPVWDFVGRKIYLDDLSMKNELNTILLTINAVDGSIIDRGLGY